MQEVKYKYLKYLSELSKYLHLFTCSPFHLSSSFRQTNSGRSRKGRGLLAAVFWAVTAASWIVFGVCRYRQGPLPP